MECSVHIQNVVVLNMGYIIMCVLNKDRSVPHCSVIPIQTPMDQHASTRVGFSGAIHGTQHCNRGLVLGLFHIRTQII